MNNIHRKYNKNKDLKEWSTKRQYKTIDVDTKKVTQMLVCTGGFVIAF